MCPCRVLMHASLAGCMAVQEVDTRLVSWPSPFLSFHKLVPNSYRTLLGLPCWELQVVLPLGKDYTLTKKEQKTEPGPFSLAAGPWERHRGGLQSGVTLRRSVRPLKLCRSAGQGGSAWAIKETLYIKAPLPFLLQQTRSWLHFAFIKLFFGGAFKKQKEAGRSYWGSNTRFLGFSFICLGKQKSLPFHYLFL